MKGNLKKIAIGAMTIILLIPGGCRKKSTAEVIHDRLENIIKLAEKKATDPLMECLTADYQDFELHGKSETQSLLNDHFRQFKGIVIHPLSFRLKNVLTDRAQVELEIALSSGAAEVLRQLIPFSFENYRFMLNLRQDAGNWVISYAEWKPIPLEELYPESLAVFKKLFPEMFK